MKLQVAGKIYNSLVNGEGMRFVLFVSGCKHNCRGCHNKDMQNFNYGDLIDVNDIFEVIKNNSDIIQGVTYSGGDPLEQSEALILLSKRIKNELNKSIWCYTGYTLEEILSASDNKKELLKYIDVLVDGKFEENNMEGALKFTGSKNQRLIYFNNGEIKKIVTSKG